jgi:hypothetical protein
MRALEYHCQIIISWADSKEIPVPDANAERIALMNKLTDNVRGIQNYEDISIPQKRLGSGRLTTEKQEYV